MALVYFSNEFPQGDLQDLFRHVRRGSKDRRHALLAQFLDKATTAIDEEVSQLPSHLRSNFSKFRDITAWSEDVGLRTGPFCGAVDGVLLIAVQLSSFIGYTEEHPEDWDDARARCLAALGVGLLTATAVSLSSSPADLPLAGADAVRLAFRMGIHVQNISESIEGADFSEGADSWAWVINNVERTAVQAQLDFLQPAATVPDTSKVFLSATSRNSVTISGPPQRLKVLFSRSQYFRESQSIALPVYGGLCHAPHVYGKPDADEIINQPSLHSVNNHSKVSIPIFSTSSGQPFEAHTASDLYYAVILELLTQSICWDEVVRGSVEWTKGEEISDIEVSSLGSSLPLRELKSALKEDSASRTILDKDISSWLSQDATGLEHPRHVSQSKLAIVGMSCRLPGGATDTDKFWDILEQGLDVSREIPEDRFDLSTHFDPDGSELNKSATKYGCFIDEPGMFDAPFFNMSPREAKTVDPQMRLALVTAYEALEQSGYVGNRTPSTRLDRIGTYYGQAADDYREVNQGQSVSTYYIPGGCRAFGPGRINYFFKFAGPSYSIDTACSSGLSAVEVACQELWQGKVDTAVTGGMNILTNPDGFAGLCNGHFLTKGHHACKTWDATADGYCRADGIVSLVIKRLQDAEADNDRVLGTILSAGTNHSANAVSITHPHAGHQSDLAKSLLREAAVDPLHVSYVELHGTGTQAGDFEEMSGVLDVYAPAKKRRGKGQPLHLGAVKANVGHGESVAGSTSLLKVLLMLQKNAIPRHVGIKTDINPRFPGDLEKRNVHIPLDLVPWLPAIDRKRIAVVNSFGAAGDNTTMILEESPGQQSPDPDPRGSHVVLVSAKTRDSLTGNIERLVAHLEEHPNTNLADLSYTTAARRYHHGFRVAVTATDVKTVSADLTTKLKFLDSVKSVSKGNPPPIAFAFTGQGAFHGTMNLELYHNAPVFREQIEHFDRLAQNQGFPSFIPALNGSEHQSHVHAPVVTQLALLCTEMALAAYWASLGVTPQVVVGHSLGEYAAMNVAGVLSANDAIFLVGSRALMLEKKCAVGSHSMLAVRTPADNITEHLHDTHIDIACINGPSETVLSGPKDEIDTLTEKLEAKSYRCVKLPVAFAFHSQQTDPVLDDIEALAKAGVIFREPRMPIISPLLRKVIYDARSISAKYVRDATRLTVDFLSAMEAARTVLAIDDETVWLELGPHAVCTNFIKASIPSTELAVPSLRRDESNWKTITDALASLHLAGVDIDWAAYHTPFETNLRLLDLPSYCFSEKNHWLQYQGDWCLTKGNDFYTEKTMNSDAPRKFKTSPIQTSTVQEIIEDTVQENSATLRMRSDVMQPGFLSAANGHRMNNCGVVTSSIHADIAYTLGEYLYRRFHPKAKSIDIEVASLAVTKGLVARKNSDTPQVIQVTATTTDISTNVVDLTWELIDDDGNVESQFATAKLIFGNASHWQMSWSPINHLVTGRIDALVASAREGKANRFSRNMAYGLFASNLVEYADSYRGMQSVVIQDLEGFADVKLTDKDSGNWTVPPYFIDGVAHLAGFIMNCSDAMDTRANFCVTPGWKSMRFAERLTPGARYRSYVKMIPSAEDGSAYFGDVYILRDDMIIGQVCGIEFHRYPRILLDKFFLPPTASSIKLQAHVTKSGATQNAMSSIKQDKELSNKNIPAPDTKADASAPSEQQTKVEEDAKGSAPSPADSVMAEDSVTSKALRLIADEAALDVSDLDSSANFADLGVDSLMSLVIAEKLKNELHVSVSGSLFLDYPTIGDLRTWLDEYYS